MARNFTVHSPRREPGSAGAGGAVRIALAALAIILLTPSLAAAHSDYVVKPGDSLSVIASRHGVSVSQLAADNGISDVHLIRVGQVLRIPDSGASSYTVKAGDTLSEIAAAAGISTRALLDANRLGNADLIRVGQKLTLPAGTRAVAANPAAGYNNLPSRLRANPSRLTLIPSFEKWSNHYGVPTDLVMAVAYRESGWQTQVVSPKGAIGVGQILPRTADWIAGDLIRIPELDPYDPDDNIRMTARFLAWLIGYMGSTEAAMAGYYQGPGSVAARGYYDDTRAYIDNIGQIRRLFAKG
ncbi:MAG: LysM peptidoglycan-binding domain-containing protein [Acidimicrobiia bacterium]|nr:LysM peptidoglycan-binding domain-containing protein [Acidimicrobiia bacterium]